MNNDFFNGTIPIASDAKLLITIPLWYRPARLIYLIDMIRTLSEFAVARLDLLILTQTCDKDQIEIVERLIGPYQSAGKTFRVVSVRNLADQFALCWEHRKMLKDVFMGSEEYTHFIYFEDDIRFSFLNFCYFLHYRPILGKQGLIPSYLRVEYNIDRLGYFLTDQPDIVQTAGPPTIVNGDIAFVGVQNPYCALYVLDRELAGEFLASRSFDRVRSEAVMDWGIPERAAMGLCFENVPSGWSSRYVVPVEPHRMLPAYWSWIYHLPNNFTHQTEQPWGQRRIEHLFRPGSEI